MQRAAGSYLAKRRVRLDRWPLVKGKAVVLKRDAAVAQQETGGLAPADRDARTQAYSQSRHPVCALGVAEREREMRAAAVEQLAYTPYVRKEAKTAIRATLLMRFSLVRDSMSALLLPAREIKVPELELGCRCRGHVFRLSCVADIRCCRLWLVSTDGAGAAGCSKRGFRWDNVAALAAGRRRHLSSALAGGLDLLFKAHISE